MSDITVVVIYRNHLTSGELWRGSPEQIHKIPNHYARTLAEEALKKKKQVSGGMWTVRLLGEIPEDEKLWPLPHPAKSKNHHNESLDTKANNSTKTVDHPKDSADTPEEVKNPTDVFDAELKDPTEVLDATSHNAEDPKE